MAAPRLAWVVLMGVAALMAVPAGAELRPEPPADLAIAARGTVAAVPSGDVLRLQDGRRVRLAGIQAPKTATGRGAGRRWPLAGVARAGLAGLAQGAQVGLAWAEPRHDRHGRVRAHVVRLRDGTWLQGAQLAGGRARVEAVGAPGPGLAALLALEGDARAAARGIWQLPAYQVRAAEETAQAIGTYQVVTGTVDHTNPWRDAIFLNFAPNYRGSFAVRVPKAAQPAFAAADRAPTDLVGRRIRVRGWLIDQAGPTIVARHPRQIELVE